MKRFFKLLLDLHSVLNSCCVVSELVQTDSFNTFNLFLVFSDLKKDLSKRCMIIIRGTVDKGSLDVFFLKDNEYFCGDGLRSFLNHEYSISTQGG